MVILLVKLKLNKLFLLLLIAILPALLLVLLRGNVGIDLPLYLSFFSDMQNGITSPFRFEPVFELLSKLLVRISKNPRMAIYLIGAITTLFLIRSFSRSKSDIMIFAFLVFPFFYFDMTMNGLRYGLSFSIATIAIDYLNMKKYKKFVIYALISVSIQYSSVLIFAPFALSFLTKKQLLYLLFVVVFIMFRFIDFGYFKNKLDAYKVLQVPSALSGVSTLIVSFSLMFIVALYNNHILKRRLFYLLAILTLLAYGFTFITYAGLRVQATVLFTIMLLLKSRFNFFSKKKEATILIFLLGLIGFILKLRNFSTVVENVDSPFIPYHFIWEV